jgi:hypothetical protein
LEWLKVWAEFKPKYCKKKKKKAIRTMSLDGDATMGPVD